MMDYQEAIEALQFEGGIEITGNPRRAAEFFDGIDVAISAMQELQIHKDNEKRNLSRTDRLMDECTYRHENGNCLKVGGFCTSVPLSHCQRHKDWYTDYRGYKKLGTLEEVREAVEKQKAKKPLLGGNTDKLTGDIRICPCCCGIVGMDDMRADYCADCGQRIDWSEVEE